MSRPAAGLRAAECHGQCARVDHGVDWCDASTEGNSNRAMVLKLWRLRRDLYLGARLLGDLQAVEKGPAAVIRREERRFLVAAVQTRSLTRRIDNQGLTATSDPQTCSITPFVTKIG